VGDVPDGSTFLFFWFSKELVVALAEHLTQFFSVVGLWLRFVVFPSVDVEDSCPNLLCQHVL
jgi:hypothetical protein